jgi:hypothetical protein
MLIITCPGCDRDIKVPSKFTSHTIQCARCQTRFTRQPEPDRRPSGKNKPPSHPTDQPEPARPWVKWVKILVLFVVVPFIITIVGGLLIEWLKPRDKSSPGGNGSGGVQGSAGENFTPVLMFANGPRHYLSDLKPFDVQSGPWPVSSNGQLGNGKDRIKVGGVLSPKGIGMHPPEAPRFASAKFRLAGEAAVFKAIVAIDDTTSWCFSPSNFSVIGDGKVLWQSTTISHHNPHRRSQECSVDVSGVNILELRVQVVNGNTGAHSVWAEPRLLEKADTPDTP